MDKDEGLRRLSPDRRAGRRSWTGIASGEIRQSHLYAIVMDTAF